MRIATVDAFTDRAFAGNPAGVCLLDAEAPAGWMQSVAAELAVSETAFSWPEGAVRRLRWFTPAVEVDLCGHATLATAHLLRERRLASSGDEIAFATRGGRLAARLEPAGAVTLDFPADTHVEVADAATVEALEAALRLPVLAAGRGARDLVAEVADLAILDGCDPELSVVAGLARGVAVTTRGEGEIDVASRFFAPRVGVDEDPVTGSAHCLLVPWWAPRLGTTLSCEQRSARGGRLSAQLAGDRVLLTGSAVTAWEGTLAPAARPTPQS